MTRPDALKSVTGYTISNPSYLFLTVNKLSSLPQWMAVKITLTDAGHLVFALINDGMLTPTKMDGWRTTRQQTNHLPRPPHAHARLHNIILICVTLQRCSRSALSFSRAASPRAPLPAPACATRGHQDEDAAAVALLIVMLEAAPRCGRGRTGAAWALAHPLASSRPVLRHAKALHRRK